MRKLNKFTKLKPIEIDLYLGGVFENIIEGREILKLRKGIKIFSQGAEADAIYFIRSGRVKITVAYGEIRELALAILGASDFFGEGCLVGQSLRVSTATTAESSTVFKIHKRAMFQALHDQPEFSEKFIASLLVRNIDVEEDICNHLLNDVEKRLAHVLLKLNRYGRPDFLPDAKLSKLSHETLADLAGATRPQIAHFLEKFEELGLICVNRKGEITVIGKMLAQTVLAI